MADNGIYSLLASGVLAFDQTSVIANNVANALTNGYHQQSIMTESYNARDVMDVNQMPNERSIIRNIADGPLKYTSDPYHVAIKGKGYFVIQVGDEFVYTRDGAFQVDNNLFLVTPKGDLVMNANFQPIQMRITDNAPIIDASGNVLVTTNIIGQYTYANQYQNRGQILVIDLIDHNKIHRIGKNYFRTDDENIIAAEKFAIGQGMVELSNVEPIREMTEMISAERYFSIQTNGIAKSYEMQSGALKAMGDMR